MGYLAVTAGVGCASSVANAAVVFYGNASVPNIQQDPLGINLGYTTGNGNIYSSVNAGVSGSLIGRGKVARSYVFFTRGGDLNPTSAWEDGTYAQGSSGGVLGQFALGAEHGDQNYANISFDGVNNTFEAVAQFYFDGVGGGYLMSIATTNAIANPQNLSAVGGPALSISAGKAMIDAAAAIPEPSSLVLLALGATGLLARRRRQLAA